MGEKKGERRGEKKHVDENKRGRRRRCFRTSSTFDAIGRRRIFVVFLLHYFSLRSRKDGRRAGIHRVRDQDPQISTHLQSSEASSSAAAAAKRIRRSRASASEDDLSTQLDGLVGGRQPQTSRPRHDGPVAEAALSGRRDSNRKLGVPGFLLTRENINPVVRLLVSCRLQNFVVFVKNSGVKIIQNSFCRRLGILRGVLDHRGVV